jgi:hypothetical protein
MITYANTNECDDKRCYQAVLGCRELGVGVREGKAGQHVATLRNDVSSNTR